MGFKLGAFIGGVAKGASESIEELEKLNTTQINSSVKSMYHNYQEYKKEVEKKKESLRGTVGALRGLKFEDGPLDDEQLIALATNPELAKDIADTLTKNPDRLVGLSKSFIKAANVPKGQKFDDFLNDYGKKAALTSEEFAMAASNKEEGFLNKMIYGDNLKKITSASRQLGVKPEELYAYGSSKGMPSYSASLEVDYAKLKDKPDFKKIESDAQVAMLTARQTGTEDEQAKAAANLGHITFIKEFGEKKDKTQNQIEADYANQVIKLKQEGKPKEAAAKEVELRQWQKLVANPATTAVKTDADKISQANLIVAASRTMESTLKNFLPPGSFITTSNPDGTTNIEVKDLASSDKAAKGYAAGREVLIKEMTTGGKPRSEMHKNALLSAGVQFDKDGNAINPKVQYGGEAPAPAATAQTPRPRGGPMARQTAPVDTAKARSEANAAIASGADRAAVAARFKQQTGQDL
jgi:hypothetical protein